MMAPAYEAAAGQFEPEVQLIKLNSDAEQEAAARDVVAKSHRTVRDDDGGSRQVARRSRLIATTPPADAPIGTMRVRIRQSIKDFHRITLASVLVSAAHGEAERKLFPVRTAPLPCMTRPRSARRNLDADLR
jgi:hypothetical protein